MRINEGAIHEDLDRVEGDQHVMVKVSRLLSSCALEWPKGGSRLQSLERVAIGKAA